MNVDASIFNHLDFFGVGLVGRDSSGVVVCAQGKVIQGSFTPLLAEVVAIKSRFLCAIGLSWNKFIIESDALLAIKAMDNYNPSSMEASLVDFIRSLVSCVDHVSFMHCFRSANRVAHSWLVGVLSLVKTSNFCRDTVVSFIYCKL